LAFVYGWSYKDILLIPLTDVNKIMKEAKELYKRKILLQKAILAYLGVKE